MVYGKNPLTRGDFPDPDVIRVGDTYYMVSTTMYFMPGAVILRSYDLINWEIITHVYDELEDTERERLDGDHHAYGNGMWAPVLRYHDGVFHVIFVANDTHKTYHYTATDIMGPWTKSYVEGFYHDTSLLFDDDGRVYLMYGNRHIRLTEMEPDLSKPKAGGVDKIVIEDQPGHFLGYEGCHLYKVNGKYYAFFIHAHPDRWFRTEACFMADRIEGPWVGADVIDYNLDDVTYGAPGVAQGGIVDTPDGRWFGVIFADRGAVGRIPNLVPMHFGSDGFPVFDTPTKVVCNTSTRPDHEYAPIFISDGFDYEPDENGRIRLDPAWEFNHIPQNDYWTVKDSKLILTTEKIAPNVELARNTLTQRTVWPECEAIVTVDGTLLNDGDCAGLAIMQYFYGLVGVAKENGKYYAVMRCRQPDIFGEREKIEIDSPILQVKAKAHFGKDREYGEFFININGEWRLIGKKNKITFDLHHFTGARFGLFAYSTLTTGGSAAFDDFIYNYPEDFNV